MRNLLKFSLLITLLLFISLESFAQDNYSSIKVDQRGKIVEYDQNLKDYVQGLDSEEKLRFLRKKLFILQYEISSKGLDSYLSEVETVAPNLAVSLRSSDATIAEDNNKLITWIKKYNIEYLNLLSYIIHKIDSNASHKQENKRK